MVRGYSEAAMLLRQPEGKDVQAVIAIRGVHEFCVESEAPHFLELVFDDVEVPDPADPLRMHSAQAKLNFAASNGVVLTPPTVEHARQIIEFAKAVQHLNGSVLCHCGAGVSRSPAAALLCLAVWNGDGHERQCVEELLRVRPSAVPHRDLVRLGDRVLDRNGRLLDSLSAMRQ